MSASAEIERFAKDLKSSEALRAEIKALGSDQDAILRLANAKGYQFTLADVEALGAGGELSDEQLAGVAGGMTILYTDGTTTLSGGSYMGIYKSGKNVLVW
jgi:predicted ribosomally synthesized peptide with nif11-like leader